MLLMMLEIWSLKTWNSSITELVPVVSGKTFLQIGDFK